MVEQDEVLEDVVAGREDWLAEGLGDPQILHRDQADQLQMPDQPHLVVVPRVQLVSFNPLLNVRSKTLKLKKLKLS